MNSSDQALFDFYLIEQAKVLPFVTGKQGQLSAAEKTKLFIMTTNYKIDDFTILSSHPTLMQDICRVYNQSKIFTNQIQKTIMDSSFFHKRGFNGTLEEFIIYLYDNNTDPQVVDLLSRIQETCSEYEECLICMDRPSDSFTECGHSLCKDCFGKLKSSDCPFCRHPISKVMDKKEMLERKEEIRTKVENDLKEGKITELPVVKKLKPISVVTDIEAFLKKRASALFSAGTGKLSQQNMDEITLLVEHRAEYMIDLLAKPISSEEFGSFVLGKLSLKLASPAPKVKISTEGLAFLDKYVVKMINNPNRMLRYLSVLHGQAPDGKSAIITKMSKTYRKLIVKMIDGFEMSPQNVEQFSRHIPIWKKLFRSIHAGEYKEFKNAQKFISCCRENEEFPIKSNSSQLEAYFSEHDSEVFTFFEKNPGLFFRNVNRLSIDFSDEEEKLEKLCKIILPKLKPEQMLELLHVLDRKNQKDSGYMTKNGTFKWLNSQAPTVSKHQEMIRDILRDSLKFKKVPGVNLVVLDMDLKRTLISKGAVQEPILNLPKIPSSRGSTIDLTEILAIPDVELVFFQYWKNGAERIDLDLSFIGFDRDFCCNTRSTGWFCDFTNRNGFNRTANHSGDITDAPKGASEFIRFNYKDLTEKKENILMEYLTMVCFSFNGVPFEEMGEAYCGVGYKSPKLKGYGPFESIVIDGCRLKGECQVNIPAVINLKKKELTFMSVNLKKKKGGSIAVSNSSKLIGDLVRSFLMWKETSSAPVSWYEIGLNVLTFYDQLVLKKGREYSFFARGEKETVKEFYNRIVHGGETDKAPEEIMKVLKGGNPDKDAKPIIYFGNNDLKLPSNSVVVSPAFSLNTDIVYLDDPFKLLHIK